MSVKTDVTQPKKESSAFDLAVVLLQAVAIAIVIRIFLFQPFNIPSGSMIPTLLIGDYLFVSKYSYGYSKYSFPLGFNLFEGRVLSSEPERGDVIVFKTPRDNSTDYIKRLVGLPGDKIQMIGGVLNINGEPVKRERVEEHRRGYEMRTWPSGSPISRDDAERPGLLHAEAFRDMPVRPVRRRRRHRCVRCAPASLFHDGR